MSTLFPDTSPEAERVLIRLLREAPPWRKLELMADLNKMARSLTLSGLRQRHPQATSDELYRRLAGLMLGPALAARVYGSLPESEADDVV